MQKIEVEVESLLIDIEAELRNLGEWSASKPSAQALASVQPFCIDTLKFSEWMQFIFIVRIRAMLKANIALPNKCGIAPMAEEYFLGLGLDSARLVDLLEQMDKVLSAHRAE